MAVGIETERKFIIRMPEIALLAQQPDYAKSEITQTYFDSGASLTHRVRKRESAKGVLYTETKKTRISRMSVIEDEQELSEAEYLDRIATHRQLGTHLHKTRHIFSYGGRLFEVDIYPAWKQCAIMEIEFSSEDECIKMPPFVDIIKEVTGIKGYSNFAMAIHFPDEPSRL